MSQKTIDFEKVWNEVFEVNNPYETMAYHYIEEAMKAACIQSIELAYEDAAENAKAYISQYTANGKVWSVDKESILSRKDTLIERLKLK